MAKTSSLCMLLSMVNPSFFSFYQYVFDWYYDVIIIVLVTINFQQHRERILISIGFTFTRVSLRALKDNIQYDGTSCHCFQATNRNWLKIRFPQSLPRRASTEREDYWERDCMAASFVLRPRLVAIYSVMRR